MIAVLTPTLAHSHKDFFRTQSPAKDSLTVQLPDHRTYWDAIKALKAIKSSADYDIAKFVLHYPALASVDPTRIEGPDATSVKDSLLCVTIYVHTDNLTQFLQGESHIVGGNIPNGPSETCPPTPFAPVA